MKLRTTFTAKALMGLASLALVATLGSCAQSQRDPEGTSSEGSQGGGTFVFAASSDPLMLDPALASDGETFRVARQMFEGLVGTEPGHHRRRAAARHRVEGIDGRQVVHLHPARRGQVPRRHRLQRRSGLRQLRALVQLDRPATRPRTSPTTTASCSAASRPARPAASTPAARRPARPRSPIKLNSPFAAFVQAMTLPAFSMQSPTAMEQYDADNTTGTETTRASPSTPPRTRPAPARSCSRSGSGTRQVTLKRNDGLLGREGQGRDGDHPHHLATARPARRSCRPVTIDGYDLVGPGDVQALEDRGFQIQQRPAFNILYLGLNQANPVLKDLKVRQAIDHAIDKEALMKQFAAPRVRRRRSTSCLTWSPATTRTSTTYAFDQEKAKELLKEAGQENLTLKFNYPTGVSRPYMPSPEDTSRSLKAQLEAVGITVTPVAQQWTPDYLDMRRPRAVEEAGHPPARLDRRLQRPGQLPRRVLRRQGHRVGLRQPSSSSPRSTGGPQAAERGRPEAGVRGDQQDDRRLRPGCSAGPPGRRRSPSPRTCRATWPSPGAGRGLEQRHRRRVSDA